MFVLCQQTSPWLSSGQRSSACSWTWSWCRQSWTWVQQLPYWLSCPSFQSWSSLAFVLWSSTDWGSLSERTAWWSSQTWPSLRCKCRTGQSLALACRDLTWSVTPISASCPSLWSREESQQLLDWPFLAGQQRRSGGASHLSLVETQHLHWRCYYH